MERVDVAVVGAGPAGLAATVLLAEHGARAAVIDERPRPGGQIYRQPPETFSGGAASHGRDHGAGATLLAAAAAAPEVRWLPRTLAWGLFEPRDAGFGGEEPGWVIGLSGAGGTGRLAASHVLVAAGAYDLPVAFPGWTLPGVMTAGGVQAFVKSDKVLPGGRFVLAGGHPLLLVVADQLLASGAGLAAVAFVQPRPRAAEAVAVAARLRGRIGPIAGVAGPMRRLRRRGVPVLFSRLVAAADGESRVEAVTLQPVDRAWRPRGDGVERFECDTLALGYGFVPSIELPRQAGCAQRWAPAAGGWVIEHDGWLRSTRPGISVAGETTGIAGAEQAADEGRLAAIGILRELGRIGEDEAVRLAAPVRRRLARLRRFSSLAQERFAPRYDALARLADDETIVCRCEELTAGALRATLAAHRHLGDADAVKLLTRTGMGRCQGRFCMLAVASLVAEATGRDPVEIGSFTARPPVRPVAVRQLADAPTMAPIVEEGSK